MDSVITRRALVKGGLIAGALVPVAGSLSLALLMPTCRHWIRVIRPREGAITLQNRRSPMHIAAIVRSIRRREIRWAPARSSRERA